MAKLKRYYIDASGLPQKERKHIKDSLDKVCFMANYDMKNIGCFEAFIEENYDLQSLARLPDSCKITRL